MAENSEIISSAENTAAISKKEECLQNGIIKTPETSGAENEHVKEVPEPVNVEESEPVSVPTNTEDEQKNIIEVAKEENETKIEQVTVKEEKETSTQIKIVEGENETKLQSAIVKDEDDEIELVKAEVKEHESTIIIINGIKENHTTILEEDESTKNTEAETINDQLEPQTKQIIKNSTIVAFEDQPPTRTPPKQAVQMVRWETTKSVLFILFLILFIIWVGLFVAKYYYFTDIKL